MKREIKITTFRAVARLEDPHDDDDNDGEHCGDPDCTECNDLYGTIDPYYPPCDDDD